MGLGPAAVEAAGFPFGQTARAATSRGVPPSSVFPGNVSSILNYYYYFCTNDDSDGPMGTSTSKPKTQGSIPGLVILFQTRLNLIFTCLPYVAATISLSKRVDVRQTADRKIQATRTS